MARRGRGEARHGSPKGPARAPCPALLAGLPRLGGSGSADVCQRNEPAPLRGALEALQALNAAGRHWSRVGLVIPASRDRHVSRSLSFKNTLPEVWPLGARRGGSRVQACLVPPQRAVRGCVESGTPSRCILLGAVCSAAPHQTRFRAEMESAFAAGALAPRMQFNGHPAPAFQIPRRRGGAGRRVPQGGWGGGGGSRRATLPLPPRNPRPGEGP